MEAQSNVLGIGAKYHFVIRRLHSLCGIVPVGIFLCFHLTANSAVLWPGAPGAEFQKAIERIHELGALLIPVEIVGIFIPLFFHAILGVIIWLSSTPNAQQYRYGSNIRFTLQRYTALIAFAFIIYHVWQMHWLGAKFGGGAFVLHDAEGGATGAITTAQAIQAAAWWIVPVYAIGIIASVFHLANGIWTLLITWGITIKPQSQRGSGYVCAAIGVVLGIVGLAALIGFTTFDVNAPAAAPTGHGVALVTPAP